MSVPASVCEKATVEGQANLPKVTVGSFESVLGQKIWGTTYTHTQRIRGFIMTTDFLGEEQHVGSEKQRDFIPHFHSTKDLNVDPEKTADIHKVTLSRRVTYRLTVGVEYGREKQKNMRARKKE